MAQRVSEQGVTEVVTVPQQTVTLKLRKPKTEKNIKWAEDTVDNENMGKKKSKCCCIYNKPKLFGESSSDESEDDETDHCRGHKGKCYFHNAPDPKSDGGGSSEPSGAGSQ